MVTEKSNIKNEMLRPLRFTLNVQATDCYIYAGHLFLTMQDGMLIYVPLKSLMHQLYSKYEEYAPLLKLAYSRNDFFSSQAGKLFLELPEVNKAMKNVWRKASDEEFYLDWDDISNDIVFLEKIISPILDVRMYATNLYLGCKDGLYESNLNLDIQSETINPNKLVHKFDAKVVGLNSGYGNVIISSGNNGLFNAPLNEETNKVKVIERPCSPISFRTGWSSTDLVNYNDINDFDYLVNEVRNIKKNKDGIIPFSKFDSKKEKKIITKFGLERYTMDSLLKRQDIKKNDILYVFNSSTSSFIYTKGCVYVINFKENSNKGMYLSSKTTKEYEIDKIDRPLSASVVPAGCVIEYMDSVILSQGNSPLTLEEEPTFSVRSFMNSIRYRYLVAVTKMNEITFHSLQPFDTYKFQPEKELFHNVPDADVFKGLNTNSESNKSGDLPF